MKHFETLEMHNVRNKCYKSYECISHSIVSYSILLYGTRTFSYALQHRFYAISTKERRSATIYLISTCNIELFSCSWTGCSSGGAIRRICSCAIDYKVLHFGLKLPNTLKDIIQQDSKRFLQI